MIVVDASVAAQWLLNEPGSAEALSLLDRCGGELIAPLLIRIEVLDAILRRVREGGLTEPEGAAACLAWDQMIRDAVITLVGDDQLRDRAVRLALELGHTVPDCLYLALAIERSATLLTADPVLHSCGQKVHRSVQLLGEAA